MRPTPAESTLWALARAERAAPAGDLTGYTPAQWRSGALCDQWNVKHIVAHLSAAASLNQRQWLPSMLGTRFRPEVHNQRRPAERRGATASETLDRFRAIIDSTTAPSSHIPA